ncbi:MAG: UDP-N-acetylmuramoyl-L-alanyl-D-glutamate--2,6-diaminopimelate ligase [Gammaproteobacteria bacterium]|nr:UDP-N-acetylmuramoyl-L-alanyl-D-glutamate--2,6-diaminopimelate ligase [Gammaproteobacteria bacterium]
MSAVTGSGNAPVYRLSLAALLEGIVHPLRDVQVMDLTQDSRQAVAGSVFLACPGRTSHGVAHAAAAVERGAVAVLWQPAPGVEAPQLPPHVVVHAIPDLSQRVGQLADRFFREPSRELEVAGVTGTNGKTTTAYLLAQAADAVGRRGSYLGTIGFGRPGALRDAGLTTPDCVTVHRRLAQARDAGAKTLSLEVSSHALDQGRVDGVRFDTAVFTNLTRDHLDYHGTLEAYGQAKARLFRAPGLRCAVANVRDPFGRELADTLDPSLERVLFSTSNEIWAPAGCGWIRLPELRATTAGLTLHVESSWGAGTLRSPLVGEFNAENLLAVLGVLLGWRVPLQQALVALANCVAPPGRMEAFGGGAQPLALVDYAHSPDALAKVLDAARAHARGRLICVFGCGGDRDPGKRPMMGEIAESRADLVVVTDDNPRTEDSRAIIEQVLAGMRRPDAAHVIVDRAEAIHFALAEADAGDVVVIAGKGHEDYQVVGHEVRPFSDRAVVLDALGEEA